MGFLILKSQTDPIMNTWLKNLEDKCQEKQYVTTEIKNILLLLIYPRKSST